MDVFRYELEPPAGWQRELEALAPRSDRTTWLHLAWMPGDTWAPVQRWAVFEMVPLPTLYRDHHRQTRHGDEGFLLPALWGPNPRTLGRPIVEQGRIVGWKTGAMVTLQQWRLWREFNAFAMPVWIIQGRHGGHPRNYSDVEEHFLRLRQLPSAAPAPGSLEYADLDGRVTEQLRARDRLARWPHARSFERRTMKDVRGELHEDEKRYRRELSRYIDGLCEAAADAARQLVNVSDLPYRADARQDLDELEDEFINDTESQDATG